VSVKPGIISPSPACACLPVGRGEGGGEGNAIQEKLTELAKTEAEVYRTAFEKEKDLTDRALKLAEIGRPKSNWEIQGISGLAAFVLGFLAGK
jgi:hypothetical protein